MQYTIMKNTEALIDASKEVGLEVKTEKTKYMLCCHQIAGQNHNMKIANRYFEAMGWTAGFRFPTGARFFSSP
jgi:hypothetical protein